MPNNDGTESTNQEEQKSKKLFDENFDNDILNNKEIDNDDELDKSDKDHLIIRNGIYTNLLKEFMLHIKITNQFKYQQRPKIIDEYNKYIKWIIVSIIALTALSSVLVTFGSFYYNLKLEVFVSIIASFITLIGSLILITGKVSDFIYNSSETQQVGEVIKNIQDYDKEVREKIFARFAKKHDGNAKEN